MTINKRDIFVWYECDYSGGPDWSLIDLVKNWPDKSQKFVVYVNKNHEGIELLKSKSDLKFIIKIMPKYFYFSYWSNILKKKFNSKIYLILSLPILLISSITIFILSFMIFLKNRPKVILFSNGGYPGGFSNFPSMLSAYFLRIEKRWMIVRSHVNKVKFLSILNIISKLTLHGMVAISKVIKCELISDNCFYKEKILVIYPGIDHEKKQGQIEIPPLNNRIVIGIIGHLSKRKGHEVLLNSIGMINNKYKNIKLLIIGSDVRENQDEYSRKYHLKKLAHSLDISNIIIWINYTKNIFNYLRCMDILVLPSVKDESFGRVIVEGMALGVPVIGSKTGGIPEIILHKENGLLFEMGSSQDLSNKIELLINDPILKDKIIQNGRKTFFNNFFVKTYVNNYYNILS